MENKRTILSFFYKICSLLLAVFITGCTKVETTKTYTVTDTTAQTTIAADELTVNNEFDQATDDAVAVLCNPQSAIAGALVDTSLLSSGIIEIDYYGKESNVSKSRTGSDSIYENTVNGHIVPWKTAGASATMKFGTVNLPYYEVMFLTNGEVPFLTSNASITFISGSATLTNIYGGSLQSLKSPGDSLVEHIEATFSFTYNDNTSQIQSFTWQINQVRVFTKSDTAVYTTTRGDTTINGYSHISTWGTTRLGSAFYTTISTYLIQNISNPYLSYNPLSGSKTIEGIPEPILCLYGVNSQGSIQANGTPYGFYISWINNTIHATSVVPYYY